MRLGTPIDYLSSRGGRFPNDNLGNNRPLPVRFLGLTPRLAALLVIVVGLLTFFLPLVSIDPPVLDKTHWSAFDIVQAMYQGHLHAPAGCARCGEPAVRAIMALPLLVTVIYGLLVVALLPLSIPYALNTVATISGLGVIGCLFLSGHATAWGFEETFYGHWSGTRHVHGGLLQLALLGDMVTLFLISIIGDEGYLRRRWLPDA